MFTFIVRGGYGLFHGRLFQSVFSQGSATEVRQVERWKLILIDTEKSTRDPASIIAAQIRMQQIFLFHSPARVYKLILHRAVKTNFSFHFKTIDERNPHEAL